MILNVGLCEIEAESFRALTGLSSGSKPEEFQLRGALHSQGLCSRGTLMPRTRKETQRKEKWLNVNSHQ